MHPSANWAIRRLKTHGPSRNLEPGLKVPACSSDLVSAVWVELKVLISDHDQSEVPGR